MRYLLFGDSDFYYAKGGAHDLLLASDNVEELIQSELLKETGGFYDIAWWHIFDCKEQKIIAGTLLQAHGAEDLRF